MEKLRQLAVTCTVFLLLAINAFAQVRITALLEKERYLQGEPVVVILDALNVGQEPVVVGSEWGEGVTLSIADTKPREFPRLFGCFPDGSGGVSGSTSHRPQLAPGSVHSTRLLLKGYDLSPGKHQLAVSGQMRFHWLKQQEPVPGTEIAEVLTVNVGPATYDELRAAFAPLVAEAEAATSVRSVQARAAIIESAPPFLAQLIARFAPPYMPGEVAEALRRIGTPESRALLMDLYERTAGDLRPPVVLAMARSGDPGLTELLSRILADPSADISSRRHAALRLGLIGGERAVRDLERALAGADDQLRSDIVTALGNTRSKLAVPILIGQYGINDTENAVCNSLRVLTHRRWCDGAGYDPAAKRRRWLRSWDANGSSATIYGLDSCEALYEADREAAEAAATLERSFAAAPPFTARPSGRAPKITSVVPSVTSPRSWVAASGYSLGAEDALTQQVLFVRGSVTHAVKGVGGGRSSKDGIEDLQYLSIEVPGALEPGRWHLVIEANGRRTAPLALDVVPPRPIEWQGIFPSQPHPSQPVWAHTRFPPQQDDALELVDAHGVRWPFEAGAWVRGFDFALPRGVAEGEAAIRVLRKSGEAAGPPFKFRITSGPSPLTTTALAFMKPVAARQWTKLTLDTTDELEVDRVDRVEIEFAQRGQVFTAVATGTQGTRVQIPAGLRPGIAMARNRTWIEDTASEWSLAVPVRIAKRALPVSVEGITVRRTGTTVWLLERNAPRFIEVRPGDDLMLFGHFRVAQPTDLRVQLTGKEKAFDLPAADLDGELQIKMPANLPSGEWQLRIGPVDRSTPLRAILELRVR